MDVHLNWIARVLALLLLMGISVAPVSASEWQIETVDAPGSVGECTSLALDPTTGDPRISYYDFQNSDLKFAAWNGSAWQNETVDTLGDVGYYTSLALDPTTGDPRISYYDGTNGDLKYASWNGSALQIETVDAAGNVGAYTSLALDPTTGEPRIAYQDRTNGSTDVDLKYAAWNGSAWQIETVDTEGNVGWWPSLALDPVTGEPRISYLDLTNNDLRYAALNGSAWQIETVDAAGVVGWWTSLALDPTTGDPRISYTDRNNDDLRYAAWNGSVWQVEIVDAVGGVGFESSLALDPATGYPRISYRGLATTGDNTLKYAAWNGSVWQIETVDAGGSLGQYTSLALDPTTGDPRISYYDGFPNEDLKYAALAPGEVPPSSTPTMIPKAPLVVNPTDQEPDDEAPTAEEDVDDVTETPAATESDEAPEEADTTAPTQTPAEAAADLVTLVDDLELPGGTENALTTKLDNAIEKMDSGNTNAAGNNLNAFINQVEAQKGKKLTAEEADAQIAMAQTILEGL